MSVQPRVDPSLKYNANIKKTLVDNKAYHRKNSALRFTNRMLPEIDMNQTGLSEMQSNDKFISVVPKNCHSKAKQKIAFTKQKKAHPDNMSNVLYRVHLRDQNFMGVQARLQTMNEKNTNLDPEGVFEYTKHNDLVQKLSKDKNKDYLSSQMEHLLPTAKEKELQRKVDSTLKRD